MAAAPVPAPKASTDLGNGPTGPETHVGLRDLVDRKRHRPKAGEVRRVKRSLRARAAAAEF